MRSRVFRCLVCLLVAAVMIVNLSPLYVHATSTAVTAVVVGVGIVVATAIAFQALGVRQGSEPTAFQSLVSECSSALSADWAVKGLVNMLAVNDGILTKTYASQNFMQSVLDWLYGNEILCAKEEFVLGEAYALGKDAYYEVLSYPYYCIVKVYSYVWFFGSQTPITIEPDANTSGSYWIRSTSSDSIGYRIGPWGEPQLLYNGNFALGGSCTFYDVGSAVNITSPYDITLDAVGQDIDTDYDTYVDEGIVSVDFGIQFEDDPNTGRNEDDDNNAFWLPAAIPGLNEGVYTDQTQADAQSGLTDPDIIQQLLDAMNGSGNGSGTGDNTGSENWSPSDMGNFTLDLSRYFPFCIPFDLYDFFTCLNADPVAPVIEWVIPVPGGDTYPLEIDLSPFDPVAQLLRRLQLLLFCVGLAFKTRDLIKG